MRHDTGPGPALAEGTKALADGDLPTAEQAFTAALESRDADASPDQSVTAHIGLGRICLARNDFRGADLRFDHVQRLSPTKPDGFYWAGCVAAHQANYPRAEWLFGAALELDAKLGKAYLQRAYVRLKRQQDDLALTDLLAAAQHQSVDENARLLTAALLLRTGDCSRAETFLADVDAQRPEAAAILGMIRHHQGKAEATLAEYERALAGGCRDETLLLHHGLTAYQLGNYTAAIDSWTALRDLYPQHRSVASLVATAHHARAAQRVSCGEFSAAIEDLTKAAAFSGELAASLAETHLHRANQAIQSDDLASARTHLRASADPRARRYLPLLDFLDGRHTEAARGWRLLLDQTPDDSLARYGLVVCALRSGLPVDIELRGLITDTSTPKPIRHAAAQALAACLVKAGDWTAALDVLASASDPAKDSLLAEALYRAGRFDELSELPENPWHNVILGLSDPTAPAIEDERARRELALRLSDAGLAAAQEGEWDQAAALLRRRNDVLPGEPDLIEALIVGLGGDRSTALAWLARASAADPTNQRIAHVQALMQLHLLSAGTDQPDAVDAHSCIGAWVSVLSSEAYWEHWPRGAQRRYGHSVPVVVANSVRMALRDFIEDRLPTNDLVLALRREHDAARSLDHLGGLPMGETWDMRLACGPLRITELGLAGELSEFLSTFTGMDDTVDVVRRQFSQLGIAEVHLAAGRPREAARAALDLRCPSCAEKTTPSYLTMISEPVLCEPDCGQFDVRNPSFSSLDGKHEQLSRSSAALAADTLLGIARNDITRGVMDLAEARKFWRAAITLATGFGSRDDVLRVVVDDALGRAKALDLKLNWSDAIAVLEAVLIVIPARDAAERERVTPALARLLNTRGVHYFNDKHENELAHADLSRAMTLGPHLKSPRLNLGVVIRSMGYRALRAHDLTRGIGLLREAIDHFEQGLRDWPDDLEFSHELAGTRADLDIALGRPPTAPPAPPQPGTR